ncbi:NAD-dependent epimerase/dehydratase family protein [Nocardia sp. NBC_00508]|uniref:NAD-dependent epimerase/dehydratase family protein n=1 Tax=Nocardia sp. NBC_00508 TaxID=2975992 RepID=UPI002E813276|nr:NAD-dependent epimerase/dehydratase family protein [Nocardia sp. NBC_00508]WUD64501.1 NAD-dependent epimerase/dehydratase family protein [Nocardia sp. NBC_00508]
MVTHVIVGRGATASATAALLAESGDRVRMVSRSGAGPEHPNIERIALDALDTAALTAIAEHAETVFNMAMPAYHTWPDAIPPLFGSILAAAEQSGANYVMLGNLYGYGPADGPLTEQSPLAATGPKGLVRARMWREAEEAHRAGRVRVTEVRASQFVGPGAISVFTMFAQPNIRSGRLVLMPQALDLPHAYTAIGDAAAAAVAVARDERAWGRAWHAPVITATVRDLAVRFAAAAGAPEPQLAVMSDRELTLLGYADPFWIELFETYHMSHATFTVDDAAIRDTFGLKASDPDEVFAEVVRGS